MYLIRNGNYTLYTVHTVRSTDNTLRYILHCLGYPDEERYESLAELYTQVLLDDMFEEIDYVLAASALIRTDIVANGSLSAIVTFDTRTAITRGADIVFPAPTFKDIKARQLLISTS